MIFFFFFWNEEEAGEKEDGTERQVEGGTDQKASKDGEPSGEASHAEEPSREKLEYNPEIDQSKVLNAQRAFMIKMGLIDPNAPVQSMSEDSVKEPKLERKITPRDDISDQYDVDDRSDTSVSDEIDPYLAPPSQRQPNGSSSNSFGSDGNHRKIKFL